MRKNIASRKTFPTDESVIKILFLNIRNFTNRWTKRHGWDIVMNQLMVLFGDRIRTDLGDTL
jgi:transposase-like protein